MTNLAWPQLLCFRLKCRLITRECQRFRRESQQLVSDNIEQSREYLMQLKFSFISASEISCNWAIPVKSIQLSDFFNKNFFNFFNKRYYIKNSDKSDIIIFSKLNSLLMFGTKNQIVVLTLQFPKIYCSIKPAFRNRSFTKSETVR